MIKARLFSFALLGICSLKAMVRLVGKSWGESRIALQMIGNLGSS